MFYRVVWNSNIYATGTAMIEDFENAGGWMDHPQGVWTQIAITGTWISQYTGIDGYCYATSMVGRSRSGERYIGLPVFSLFELPTSDYPTQVTAWVRGPINQDQGVYLDFEYYDGVNWWTDYKFKVASTTYSQAVWNLTFGVTANQRLRLKMWYSSVAYVDDITIKY